MIIYLLDSFPSWAETELQLGFYKTSSCWTIQTSQSSPIEAGGKSLLWPQPLSSGGENYWKNQSRPASPHHWGLRDASEKILLQRKHFWLTGACLAPMVLNCTARIGSQVWFQKGDKLSLEPPKILCSQQELPRLSTGAHHCRQTGHKSLPWVSWGQICVSLPQGRLLPSSLGALPLVRQSEREDIESVEVISQTVLTSAYYHNIIDNLYI